MWFNLSTKNAGSPVKKNPFLAETVLLQYIKKASRKYDFSYALVVSKHAVLTTAAMSMSENFK